MFEENNRTFFENIPDVKGVFEKRVVPDIPLTLILNEKFGGVNMFSIDGRADNAVFYCKNPAFL